MADDPDETIPAGTNLAPVGKVWLCGACGKRARSKYGFDSLQRSTVIDHGWDESCMLNSVLVTEEEAVEARKKAGLG